MSLRPSVMLASHARLFPVAAQFLLGATFELLHPICRKHGAFTTTTEVRENCAFNPNEVFPRLCFMLMQLGLFFRQLTHLMEEFWRRKDTHVCGALEKRIILYLGRDPIRRS